LISIKGVCRPTWYGEFEMKIKFGVLAAAAALALTVPAAAFAQPFYGHDDYGRHVEFRRDHDDWRRIELRREELRRQEWRRLQWEREHARYGYVAPYYRALSAGRGFFFTHRSAPHTGRR
jgi:hypothetical protein